VRIVFWHDITPNLGIVINCFFNTGYRVLCGIALALATYQSIYPISLMFPAVICIFEKEKSNENTKSCFYSSLSKTVASYLIPLVGILYISQRLTGGWDFLDSTYGFM